MSITIDPRPSWAPPDSVYVPAERCRCQNHERCGGIGKRPGLWLLGLGIYCVDCAAKVLVTEQERAE